MFAAKTVWTAIVWALGLGPIGRIGYTNAAYPILRGVEFRTSAGRKRVAQSGWCAARMGDAISLPRTQPAVP
jgi:hypothetical protein